MGKFIDLTGQTIGNFKVIKRIENNKKGQARWLCTCLFCGGSTIQTSSTLTGQYIYSCGCQTKQRIREKNSKHGLRHTRLYNIWHKMRQRCQKSTDKLYKYYGERGIKVCKEWNDDFKIFYDWSMSNGYTDKLTLDRIDVNGNYEPCNCRWVTMKIQCSNKRSNVLITYNGKTQTLTQWCDELNLPMKLVHSRLKYKGWTVEEAFNPPVKETEKLYTYNDKTQSLSDWCQEYNISDKLVRRRMKDYNWAFSKALTTPNRAPKRRK